MSLNHSFSLDTDLPLLLSPQQHFYSKPTLHLSLYDLLDRQYQPFPPTPRELSLSRFLCVPLSRFDWQPPSGLTVAG